MHVITIFWSFDRNYAPILNLFDLSRQDILHEGPTWLKGGHQTQRMPRYGAGGGVGVGGGSGGVSDQRCCFLLSNIIHFLSFVNSDSIYIL